MLPKNATSAWTRLSDKAQHEVMVIIASNVATQGCYRSYKNRVRPLMELLLAPIYIVIKSPLSITILQFYAAHIGTICLADIAFLGSMGIGTTSSKYLMHTFIFNWTCVYTDNYFS